MPAVKVLIILSAFFLALPSIASADALKGKAVFGGKGCGACHETSGPPKEKTISDVLVKKGPELWYSGSKFRAGFLAPWLKDPKPIRPMRYYSLTEENPGDHPRLASGEAQDVADYLMGLKSPLVKDKDIPLGAELVPPGRVAFIKKYACYGCHMTPSKGKVVGGLTGPGLTGASKRLNPAWVYAYLSNSKAFKPVKDMPEYAGIMPDSEMRAISAYINTFE